MLAEIAAGLFRQSLAKKSQRVVQVASLDNLYLHPPPEAIILAVDEKCQIQALERTQRLPWKKGRGGTLTHDYKRHGTTTLFAAMNTQDGTVMDICMPKHRHQEWIQFLQLIRQRTPGDKDVHLIMDNYSAHKDPAVQKWLAKQPAFTLTSPPPVLLGSTWWSGSSVI